MLIDKIENIDCLEGMKAIDDESIDCVVTSPPYDNLRDYGGVIDGWTFDKFKEIARELFRVVKQGGVCVWVVADETVDGSESLSSFRQALYFREIGFKLHDTMIYNKENPCPVGGPTRYYQSFEYMFVFSKGTPKTFNPLTEERRNKYDDKRTMRFKGFQTNADGTRSPKLVRINQSDPKRRNVWSYTLGSSDHTGHPAVFPYKLAVDHILSWTNEGDIVLDPFIGSGTTAVAAVNLNRHYIGFELNEEYHNIAETRVKNAALEVEIEQEKNVLF